MKAKIVEPGTKIYDRTGFSALPVAELPVGDEVEILTSTKVDGHKWISVTLADGRSGFMPGDTKVFANERRLRLQDAYSKASLWKTTERADAKNTMLRGALWFIGGVVAIAADVYIVYSTISARSQDTIFPVKPVLLGGIVAVIYGGFKLLIGALAYFRTVAD